MEPGIYVTFFAKDEPANRDLPPVGPLVNVVLRQRVLIAERPSVQQAQELDVAIDRWLEAELEMQRATGQEPGVSARPERRFSARDGVFVRFAVFGDMHERDLVPELGPFAVVVVGTSSVEADGAILATRVASELAPWELTTGAGDDAIGLHKPDIAFRTANTDYHPSIAPARSGVAPPRELEPAAPPPTPSALDVPAFEQPEAPQPAAHDAVESPPPSAATFVDRPRKQIEIYSVNSEDPAAEEDEPELTIGDRELIAKLDQERRSDTLRARIQHNERKRLGIEDHTTSASTFAMRYRGQDAEEVEDETEVASEMQWGPALWRLRFAIVGVLLVLAATYTALTLRGGISFGPSAPDVRYVGLTERVNVAGWEYVVNTAQRAPTSGTAKANGTFYILRIAATNNAGEGQQLAPSTFTLIDANGTSHAAEGLNSGVYAPGSGLTWPTFVLGQSVSAPVVFDIDPTLGRGMVLAIDGLPNLRVQLD